MAADTAVTAPAAATSLAPVAWIKAGSGYSEAQTFYLFPKSGGVIFVQVVYSEVSLSPLSQVTVRVATPQANIFKSFNYSGSTLKINEDKAGSTCQDYSVTRRSDGTLSVSLKFKEVSATFDVALDPAATVQAGDGKIYFTQAGASKPDGFLSQIYGLRGATKGVFTVNGTLVDVEGPANVVQQHQGIAPHKLALEWDFLTLISPSVALSSVVGITPPTYRGERFSTLAAHVAGHGTAVSTSASFTFPTTVVDATTGYATPTKFTLTSTLNSGHTIEATANLDFARVHRIDVLGELPWLLRKAVQLLVSKPFVYQFVEQTHIVVRDAAGAVVVDEAGTGFFEVSFTNPSN